VGTPNFVAPEIVLAQDYDGTADQYSLAMTVYAALAGRCPLEGKTASATLVNQTSKYPAPLQQVAPDVNDAMSKAVRKALSKKPEDRYSSCVEFADAVLSALDPSSQSSASSHSTVRQGAPFFRVVATSKVKKGVAPCPHCKKPLAIKPHYGGQRGSCVSCKVKLYVTQDRREVRQIQYVGGNQELHASGELIIGQVVFGWKLNKYAVMALLACCGIAVVSSAIYIGRKSAEPEKREPPSKVGFEARSKADSALGK
jgi:serine/threonine-protein kinase